MAEKFPNWISVVNVNDAVARTKPDERVRVRIFSTIGHSSLGLYSVAYGVRACDAEQCLRDRISVFDIEIP